MWITEILIGLTFLIIVALVASPLWIIWDVYGKMNGGLKIKRNHSKKVYCDDCKHIKYHSLTKSPQFAECKVSRDQTGALISCLFLNQDYDCPKYEAKEEG